jgi:hypothetical protein
MIICILLSSFIQKDKREPDAKNPFLTAQKSLVSRIVAGCLTLPAGCVKRGSMWLAMFEPMMQLYRLAGVAAVAGVAAAAP